MEAKKIAPRDITRVVLFLLPLIIVLVLGLRLIHDSQTVPVSAPSSAKPVSLPPGQPSAFLAGADWKAIGSMNVSDAEKNAMKLLLIRVAVEASATAGKPIFESPAPLPAYAAYVDAYYARPENASLPLFFVLKTADMEKRGAPKITIEKYKTMIMQRLQQAHVM